MTCGFIKLRAHPPVVSAPPRRYTITCGKDSAVAWVDGKEVGKISKTFLRPDGVNGMMYLGCDDPRESACADRHGDCVHFSVEDWVAPHKHTFGRAGLYSSLV